jgi:hypothetical protein
MRSGATPFTVEIYAGRLNMTVEEFSSNLASETWMEENVFSRVDLDVVLSLLSTAIGDSIDLINEYYQAAS